MGVHVDLNLDGELGEYVAAVTDGSGWYANVEEYVRDLIRQDVAAEQADFEAFRAELRQAFATPEADCIRITADEVIARGRARRAA